MKYYCIKIGKTHDEVLSQKFLWAPVKYVNGNGKVINNAGWPQLATMEAGDLAFLIKDGVIGQLGIATKDAYMAPRPPGRVFDAWKKDGYRVDITLKNLATPFYFKDFIDLFHDQYNETSEPRLISEKGVFTETYSNRISSEAAKFLLSHIYQSNNQDTVALAESRIDSNFPYSAGYSWEVKSSTTCRKLCDKTILTDLETAIPKDMVEFFLEKPLDKGESNDIRILLTEEQIALPLKRKQSGRYNLRLSEIADQINLASLSINDSIWFEKDPTDGSLFHLSTQSRDKSKSVKPRQRKKPSKTGSKSTTQSRIGQDYFRDEVMRLGKGKCIVTKIAEQEPSILIASHIKAWSESSDDEKMDGHNGLLLAPHVDKLFDKHLINFDKNGFIVVSKRLPKSTLIAWNIDTSKRYKLTKTNQKYLAFHREKFAVKEKEQG
ncbi:MAG: HNH endonuclease [Aliiglaciecola sp.]